MEAVKGEEGDGPHGSDEDEDQEDEEMEEDEDEAEEVDDEKQEEGSDPELPPGSPEDESPGSPPSPSERSQAPSPSASSIRRRMASLALSPTVGPVPDGVLPTPTIEDEEESDDASEEDDQQAVSQRVATELSKEKTRQQRKYHSKKGAGRIGRPKGSKAKQDVRVKMDGGGWY